MKGSSESNNFNTSPYYFLGIWLHRAHHSIFTDPTCSRYTRRRPCATAHDEPATSGWKSVSHIWREFNLVCGEKVSESRRFNMAWLHTRLEGQASLSAHQPKCVVCSITFLGPWSGLFYNVNDGKSVSISPAWGLLPIQPQTSTMFSFFLVDDMVLALMSSRRRKALHVSQCFGPLPT